MARLLVGSLFYPRSWRDKGGNGRFELDKFHGLKRDADLRRALGYETYDADGFIGFLARCGKRVSGITVGARYPHLDLQDRKVGPDGYQSRD